MILVTGCNERYLPRIHAYLETLEQYADFPCYLVGVGFLPPVIGNMIPVKLTREQNYGAPPETECIQHGSFLNVIDAEPGEVIIYTDGDFAMQRAMDDSERAFLDLKPGEIVAGYNFDNSTLFNDAHLLGMKVSDKELEWMYGAVIHTHQDWNVGFLAATVETWRELYREYLNGWALVSQVFAHQARQQWLISYITTRMTVKICPWSIHAHGHGGLKPGMAWGDGGIWADGKLALFRHYLWRPG